jgi:hypothetical protein
LSPGTAVCRFKKKTEPQTGRSASNKKNEAANRPSAAQKKIGLKKTAVGPVLPTWNTGSRRSLRERQALMALRASLRTYTSI